MTPHTDASPHIRIENNQLVIDDAPFLVLGGELHNSSATTQSDLEARWSTLKALNLNTALIAVPWESVEPREGEFDFTMVDRILLGARTHDIKVTLLWFGSWKNGLSSYRPSWVKADPVRFPLVAGIDGECVQVLSVFSEESRDADARAFARLMRHVREADAGHDTVIMVQVQNEVGILGPSRDHTTAAREAYGRPVDAALVEAVASGRYAVKPEILEAARAAQPGTDWANTFGESLSSDELFMALGYARYINTITVAGKAEHDVPMFVNAWLDSPDFTPDVSHIAPFGGQVPGNYPSGGPLPQVLPAWLHGAPALDILTPDIYWGDFAQWCQQYTVEGAPLFIPEMKRNLDGVADLHIAIGSFGAIGTSPFGVDGRDNEYAPEVKALLSQAYGCLQELSSKILRAQRAGTIVGFHLDAEHPEVLAELGGFTVRIRRDMDNGRLPAAPPAWGIVLCDENGDYYGTGVGFAAQFETGDGRKAALDRVERVSLIDGEWVVDQVLNGDETVSGEYFRFPYLGHIPGISFGESYDEPAVRRCAVYTY
ncbi:GH35 family beta-galactosidase [Microbacterium sp. A84]|uniref:GH35 family beta-galactosidase n=1 Tax=Microbacterium sp. A84 TaxID=3450715 RepID=UPI003F42F3A9